MLSRVTGKILTQSVFVLLLAFAWCGVAVPTASAADTCYKVIADTSLNIRKRSNRFGKILTSVPHGKILKKVGVSFCGPWWCHVKTGSYDGYAYKKFLEKVDCP